MRRGEHRPPDVDALARRLPRHAPSNERAQRMRGALLDAAEGPPGRRWTRAPWLIGAVAAAAAALVLWRAREGEAPRAVEAPPIAAAPVESGAPRAVERPLLDGVTVFEAAAPLRLARGDAAITAPPGARFEVDVRGGEVRAIRVFAGSVVFAPSAAGPAMKIVERETWELAAAPPQQQQVAPPPRRRPLKSAAITERTERAERAEPPAAAPEPAVPAAAAVPQHELDFRDGLRKLVAGDARDAIAPLDRACAAPSSSAEDTCYWAAVARLRAGDRALARSALAAVLARWPASTHAGEANVALGWLLLESGDRDGARARFAAAAADRVPAVRAEAQRGLAAAR